MSDLFTLEEVTDMDAIECPRRVPRIERVPWTRDVDGPILCDRLFKLPTHHAGGRTRICPGKATCDLHKTTTLRIYFLCAVYDVFEKEAVWLQLTAPAAKALLLGAKTLERPLFGLQVKVHRKWKDKNAPVLVSVDRYTQSQIALQRPLNPEESVKRCFFSTSGKTSQNRRKPV